MTNFEAGERLLREAEEYLEEMQRAYGRGSWNIVIRRSQDTTFFYFEREYTRKEAEDAKEGAEYVLNVAKDLYIELR